MGKKPTLRDIAESADVALSTVSQALNNKPGVSPEMRHRMLGGRGSVVGPIVGAFVLTGLPHVIDLSGEVRAMLYGLILILTILVMPQGIAGALASWRRAA